MLAEESEKGQRPFKQIPVMDASVLILLPSRRRRGHVDLLSRISVKWLGRGGVDQQGCYILDQEGLHSVTHNPEKSPWFIKSWFNSDCIYIIIFIT